MKNFYIQVIPQLDKFATAFSQINSLEDLVQAVQNIMEDIFSFEYTGLYLYDSSEDRLKLLYAKGFNASEFNEADQTAMEREPGQV